MIKSRNYIPSISRSKTRNRVIFFLSILPVLDAIMGLNDEFFLIEINGLSIFQIYRGFIVLVLGLAVLTKFSQIPKQHKLVVKFIKLFLGVLLVFALKELLITEQLSMISVTAYLRIVFWLLLWLIALIYCKTVQDSTRLLYGIIIAGFIMAVAVYYSYYSGENIIYMEDFSSSAIRSFATAGGYRSGKSISGPLLVSALVILCLGRKKHSLVASFLASFLTGAAFLTYNRTGMVCIILSILGLLNWQVRHGIKIRTSSNIIIKFLLVFGAFSFLYFYIIGYEGLISRWSDVIHSGSNIGAVGSGRMGLWLAAIDWFKNTDLLNQLLGVGYKGMFNVNFTYFNNPMIHSHSDFFDLLLIGGALGVFVWVSLFIVLFKQTKKLNRNRIEFAFLGAIYSILLGYSIFTSAFYGPNVMTTIVISTVALQTILEQTKIQPNKSKTKFRRFKTTT